MQANAVRILKSEARSSGVGFIQTSFKASRIIIVVLNI